MQHKFGFIPQGCTNVQVYSCNVISNLQESHGCAGYSLTPVLLKLFLIKLCKGNHVTLQLEPGQKLEGNPSKIPLLPLDGFKAKYRSHR